MRNPASRDRSRSMPLNLLSRESERDESVHRCQKTEKMCACRAVLQYRSYDRDRPVAGTTILSRDRKWELDHPCPVSMLLDVNVCPAADIRLIIANICTRFRRLPLMRL